MKQIQMKYEEIREFRKSHTVKQTADQYGITERQVYRICKGIMPVVRHTQDIVVIDLNYWRPKLKGPNRRIMNFLEKLQEENV